MGKHCRLVPLFPTRFRFVYQLCSRPIHSFSYAMHSFTVMSTSTAPSSASSDADSLNHDENPIKAVIFDYGEVMWMQSRNVHVYRSELAVEDYEIMFITVFRNWGRQWVIRQLFDPNIGEQRALSNPSKRIPRGPAHWNLYSEGLWQTICVGIQQKS